MKNIIWHIAFYLLAVIIGAVFILSVVNSVVMDIFGAAIIILSCYGIIQQIRRFRNSKEQI